MPGLIAAFWALLALMAYVLAGAVGLTCTALFQGLPRPMREAARDGFGAVFRVGLKASATWPWT